MRRILLSRVVMCHPIAVSKWLERHLRSRQYTLLEAGRACSPPNTVRSRSPTTASDVGASGHRCKCRVALPVGRDESAEHAGLTIFGHLGRMEFPRVPALRAGTASIGRRDTGRRHGRPGRRSSAPTRGCSGCLAVSLSRRSGTRREPPCGGCSGTPRPLGRCDQIAEVCAREGGARPAFWSCPQAPENSSSSRARETAFPGPSNLAAVE